MGFENEGDGLVKRDASHVEGVERETAERLKGAFYLTQIVRKIIPRIIPAIGQIPISAEDQIRINRESIPDNKGIPGNGTDMLIVDAELEDAGIVIYNGDSSNYVEGPDGNVWYIGVLMPWKISTEPVLKIDPCFNEVALRRSVEKLPDGADKEICRQHMEALFALFAAEKSRIAPAEIVLESCEPKIVVLKEMIRNLVETIIEVAEVPEDPYKYVQVKDQFFRDNISLLTFLKEIKKTTDLTEKRFYELGGDIEGVNRVIRAKYPIKHPKEYWSPLKKEPEKQ